LRDTVFFGRAEDGVLENEFSGNLVEVCPTGVFTDATLKKHYTRKWDLQMAPSICIHCALGCNISVGERYGSVRRVINRYNAEVNGYFLCDRGRFGYEFLNSPDRMEEPRIAGQVVPKAEALDRVASMIGSGGVVGIGSPRASLEGNFALRELVGKENFFNGMASTESHSVEAILEVLRNGPVSSASLHEVELSDAVFIVGEDVTNTAPIMALRLRQSVRQAPLRRVEKMGIPLWLDQAAREVLQDERGPLFIASPYNTRLDDIATATLRTAPDDVARLAFAVAHEIDASAPEVTGLPEGVRALSKQIAAALLAAERPLVVSGCSLGSIAAVEGAAQVACALKTKGRDNVRLAYSLPESNTFGLGLFEAHSLDCAFDQVRQGAFRTAIILENDLFRRAPEDEVNAFLKNVEHVVVLDHTETQTASRADVFLPSGPFAETDGTIVSSEGRAQRFFQAFMPAGSVQESWRWLQAITPQGHLTAIRNWTELDDITASIAKELPALARISEAAPGRQSSGKIAREPNRYSGRTSMLANITVHEPKPPQDPDSALAFSMESGIAPPPPALTPFFWAPGWNSIQATSKFQSEVGGALRGGDPGVRLVDENASKGISHYSNIPPAFRPSTNDWLVVPIFHIFGSEELSRHAAGVAKLIPKAYIALNPLDAAALGVHEGDSLKLSWKGGTATLPVILRSDLPRGVAGAPAAMPPIQAFTAPVVAALLEATADLAAVRSDK
jgi:NADH-quinone oxidoreductase subunit G